MPLFRCCWFLLTLRCWDPLGQEPGFGWGLHKTLSWEGCFGHRVRSFISCPIWHKVPRGFILYAISHGLFSTPLVAEGVVAASCWGRCVLWEACSFSPASREVKSLWAEVSTDYSLYICAYQSSNSLECCTAELLPPCVCVAAQEHVYILSISKEISNVNWQINRMAFFLIGPVGRGR